ncbi:TadE/TadG family type IV pilus assembly protein [Pontitalea aquivivens]|uniref:TadE/TadG family type IV pilus assembly protein n=1 Tax=Pontitalea aquivivens TaxID=3388663 RepID=UPI003970F278
MNILKTLARPLCRIDRETGGSMPIEAVMGAALLLGWLGVSFQFYDAFRIKGINTKAAYTIADLISREDMPVGPAYIEGLEEVFEFLTVPRGDTWIRVSSIYWDRDAKEYRVTWSHATDGQPVQTHETINLAAHRIPRMPVGDSALVVETRFNFAPLAMIGSKTAKAGSIFSQIGLPTSIPISNFVVTRPRGTRIIWDDAN